MAVRDVTEVGVELALEEFRAIGLGAMRERYGGGPSTKWYVKVGHRHYDQKVLFRTAHEHEHSEKLARLGAGQVRSRLRRLRYRVVEACRATDEDLATPEATAPLMRWRKVGPNGHIRVEHNHYLVPEGHIYRA